MSAYIQCKSHIDYLVREMVSRGIVAADQADETGRILWREQVTSVQHRYPQDGPTELPGHIGFNADTDPDAYRYAPVARILTPVEILCALQGYTYQACEHPAWGESIAHRLIGELEAAVRAEGAHDRYPDVPGQFARGQSTPEYSAAGTWEICTCADDDAFAAIISGEAPTTPQAAAAPAAPVLSEEENAAADEIATDRNATIKAIRTALRRRSGKAWSVRGGTGTAWGWITISAPPARCDRFGSMTEADAAELGELLGLGKPVHHQGEDVAASKAYRREYLDRAEGRSSEVTGTPYWD